MVFARVKRSYFLDETCYPKCGMNAAGCLGRVPDFFAE